jgi:hypothetical protein
MGKRAKADVFQGCNQKSGWTEIYSEFNFSDGPSTRSPS